MDNHLELPIGDKAPEVLTAVVEIPEDCSNKYEYDRSMNVFVLDRVLHSPVHFPGDYGFIPQTLSQDGDPLDILILGDSPTFTGCIYAVRPVGLFEMLDHGVCDEKVLAYAMGNPRFIDIHNYTEIQPHVLREVEHFFSVYKELEEKEIKILGWKDREAAYEVIRSSHERFIHSAVAQ